MCAEKFFDYCCSCFFILLLFLLLFFFFVSLLLLFLQYFCCCIFVIVLVTAATRYIRSSKQLQVIAPLFIGVSQIVATATAIVATRVTLSFALLQWFSLYLFSTTTPHANKNWQIKRKQQQKVAATIAITARH